MPHEFVYFLRIFEDAWIWHTHVVDFGFRVGELFNVLLEVGPLLPLFIGLVLAACFELLLNLGVVIDLLSGSVEEELKFWALNILDVGQLVEYSLQVWLSVADVWVVDQVGDRFVDSHAHRHTHLIDSRLCLLPSLLLDLPLFLFRQDTLFDLLQLFCQVGKGWVRHEAVHQSSVELRIVVIRVLHRLFNHLICLFFPLPALSCANFIHLPPYACVQVHLIEVDAHVITLLEKLLFRRFKVLVDLIWVVHFVDHLA